MITDFSMVNPMEQQFEAFGNPGVLVGWFHDVKVGFRIPITMTMNAVLAPDAKFRLG
jgi:hypothetical protein